jgi:hypothetical protein
MLTYPARSDGGRASTVDGVVVSDVGSMLLVCRHFHDGAVAARGGVISKVMG